MPEDPFGPRRGSKKRRVAVRTPGGRTVYHYRHKIHGKARCARCGRPLTGTRTGPRSVMAKLAKSEKRPNRPYGGYLCSKCLRELMVTRAISLGWARLSPAGGLA